MELTSSRLENITLVSSGGRVVSSESFVFSITKLEHSRVLQYPLSAELGSNSQIIDTVNSTYLSVLSSSRQLY